MISTPESRRRIRALRDIPLLAGCTRQELVRVDGLGTPIESRPGRTLMREGDAGRECFLVERGIAVATRGDRRLGAIGAGSVAGELALLDRTARRATVVTYTPTRLLVLTPREFDELLAVAPSIETRIRAIAAERQAHLDITGVITQDACTAAIIPAWSRPQSTVAGTNECCAQ